MSCILIFVSTKRTRHFYDTCLHCRFCLVGSLSLTSLHAKTVTLLGTLNSIIYQSNPLGFQLMIPPLVYYKRCVLSISLLGLQSTPTHQFLVAEWPYVEPHLHVCKCHLLWRNSLFLFFNARFQFCPTSFTYPITWSTIVSNSWNPYYGHKSSHFSNQPFFITSHHSPIWDTHRDKVI